jgi:acetyl esterase
MNFPRSVYPGTLLAIWASALLKPKPAEAWDVAARRKKNDADMKTAGKGPTRDVSARDFSLPGAAGDLPARLYSKAGSQNTACVLYFHGGGWVVGGLDANDSIARGICRASGAAVLSVAYRMAPEYPFPAAPEDAFNAYRWALAKARAQGWDEKRIFAAGDSAGGTLAAVLCLMARDRGIPQPRGQILYYPVTDISRTDTESYRRYASGYLLAKADMDWFIGLYCPVEKRKDPYASPLLASDLSGLAPALVLTAERDVLRDEGEAFAKRLSEAGVSVTHRLVPGVTHAFASLSKFTPVASERAFRDTARFISG